VIVVEHDEEIIRAADLLIDMGPLAGVDGGKVVFQGKMTDYIAPDTLSRSLTLQYLTGSKERHRREKRPWRYSIKLEGVREHNLKGEDVSFPSALSRS